MATKDFALPDLGEGLTESELVSWHVAVGDTVELNQPLADVETAKALVELPSPFAGVIVRLYADPGTTVPVGAPIVAFELDEAEGDASDLVAAGGKPERESVLVGYGPPIEGGGRPSRRARKGAAPAQYVSSFAPPVLQNPQVPQVSNTPLHDEATGRFEGSQRNPPRSTPPVRKLARDLGIDLASVTGTGEKALITREDVERMAAASSASDPSEVRRGSEGGGSKESRTPIQGVRKHTAAAVVQSAFTAPHASEFLTIDVTPTTDLIATLKESAAFAVSG